MVGFPPIEAREDSLRALGRQDLFGTGVNPQQMERMRQLEVGLELSLSLSLLSCVRCCHCLHRLLSCAYFYCTMVVDKAETAKRLLFDYLEVSVLQHIVAERPGMRSLIFGRKLEIWIDVHRNLSTRPGGFAPSFMRCPAS